MAHPIQPAAEAAAMPDVARDVGPAYGRLDRVGMSGIEVAVLVRDPMGRLGLVPARAEATVSLDDPSARGIHMSRLFLALQERLTEAEIGLETLSDLLRDFVAGQRGLSRDGFLAVSYEQVLRRSSLESGNSGWRCYPVRLAGSLRGSRFHFAITISITYSSTCPCSAALSRQAIQERFAEVFSGAVDASAVQAWLGTEAGVSATPHSQRSVAEVTVVVADPADAPTITDLVDRIEASLGTPVQAAVKRSDEQAFARLNAANLMFCEDAARRVRSAIEGDCRFSDWRIAVSHRESLHPHDAVATVVAGVPGGLVP